MKLMKPYFRSLLDSLSAAWQFRSQISDYSVVLSWSIASFLELFNMLLYFIKWFDHVATFQQDTLTRGACQVRESTITFTLYLAPHSTWPICLTPPSPTPPLLPAPPLYTDLDQQTSPSLGNSRIWDDDPTRWLRSVYNSGIPPGLHLETGRVFGRTWVSKVSTKPSFLGQPRSTHQAGILIFADISYSLEYGLYLYVGANVIGGSVKFLRRKLEFVRVSLRS